MPQNFIQAPDTYRLRLRMFGGEDPSDSWVNEWDVRYPTGVTPVSTDPILADLLAAARLFHYPDVKFHAWEVYDWHVGRPLSNSITFAQEYLLGDVLGDATSAGGMNGQGGGPIGGEVCMQLLRTRLNARREGRIFMRGALQKGDVTSEAGGEWSILGNPQFAAAAAQIITSYYNPHISASSSPTQPQLVLVHTTKDSVTHDIVNVGVFPLLAVVWTSQLATNKINRRSKK